MTYVRHAARHLQETLINYVSAWLTSIDWFDTPAPFGTTPVELVVKRMRESDLIPITGNMVAISFGDEGDDEAAELGGGVLTNTATMYLDIIAVNDSIGLALASDLKDLLTGRVEGTSRFLTLNDYTTVATGVTVPDYRIEITEVTRSRPDGDVKQFWQILTVTIESQFTGEA